MRTLPAIVEVCQVLDTEGLVIANRSVCLENHLWQDLQMACCENDSFTNFKDCLRK